MRIPGFFGRPQWKLARFYAFVTAGTAIVLAALVVGFAIFIDGQNANNLNSSYYRTRTGFQDNIPSLLDDPKAPASLIGRRANERLYRPRFQILHCS